MTFRFVLATLWATVLLGSAHAQTPLGQPSLDESKVQIWCATVRFVYDDAGRPNLKSTVRCDGGNLDALAASIRPDSLRVYSLLYQPIEGRGSIYQGKKDTRARLAALAKAILGKLKGSAARRRDPARMARVAALETALTNYVTSGTPPGDVPAAMAPEAPDPSTGPTAAPDRLTPAQRLEVERLVSQRVDEELRWLRANLPELVASAVAAPAAGAATAPATTPLATEIAPEPTSASPTRPIADDVQLD